MQQHSYPSHSIHFVPPSPGLTIELIVLEAEEPGLAAFVREKGEVVELHILEEFVLLRFYGCWYVCSG